LRITRRQALLAAGAIGAGGLGLYGRFAVGGEFEDHVARQLGIDGAFARDLLSTARDVLGPDYDARAAAFVVATTAPSRHLMPRGARAEAIEALIEPMFNVARYPGSAWAIAGLRPDNGFHPCAMLLRS
jgi:hypothetical protein